MDDGDFVGDSEEENEELSAVSQEPAARVQLYPGRADRGGQQEHNEPPVTAENEPQDRLDGHMHDGNNAQTSSNDAVSAEPETVVTREKDDRHEMPAPVGYHGDDGARSDQNTTPLAASDDTLVRREEQSGPRPQFRIGDIVHVAARTWPGINKLGGAGKIVAVTTETTDDGNTEFLYSVKYMLGGFEKRIEEEFIQDLANALANGARQHKERVFYHDEFAADTQKKHKHPEQSLIPSAQINEKSSAGAETEGSKGSNREQRPKPVLVDAPDIEYKDRSSDDSDYDGKDSDDEEDRFRIRKLTDGTFILDERHVAANTCTTVESYPTGTSSPRKKKKRTRKATTEPEREANQDTLRSKNESRKRGKRAHRIIETDDESDSAELVSAKHLTPVKRKKKRRYVGGYVHGDGDPDGAFIQPEGNPTELPNDVAQELNFKLGKTKSELRAQLDTVADRLVANLEVFSAKKYELSRVLEDSSALDLQGLQDANQSLLELGEFIRKQFIRSGEDVMNQIIKLLEKKGGRLPDRIDLQYETWKQQVADYDMWVKHSLRGLEVAFSRRGLQTAFMQEIGRSAEVSSDSDFSSVSDVDGPVRRNISDEDFDFDSEPALVPIVQGTARGFHSKKRTETISDDQLGYRRQSRSKKRPRSVIQTQSSLDEFAVSYVEPRWRDTPEKPRAYAMSHFRLPGVSKQKILSDPKWDWVRKLKRNNANTRSTNNASGDSRQLARHPSSSHGHTKGTRKSGSVMEALLNLRDRRYRQRAHDPSDRVRLDHGVSIMPRSEQNIEFAQVVRTTHQKSSLKSSMPALRLNEDGFDALESESFRHWPEVFAILPDEETIPNVLPTSTDHLMELGRVFFRPTKPREERCVPDEREVSSEDKNIARLLLRIRQQFVDLRFEEHDTIDTISQQSSNIEDQTVDSPSGLESPEWKSLCAASDEYHSALISLVDEIANIAVSSSAELTLFQLQVTVSELRNLLCQIPDCHLVFGESSSYPYFFEVISPGASTTPLITAICRTFWYILQAVVLIKQVCEQRLKEVRSSWDGLFTEILPPNRVVLACCLFLVDLYVRVPSTHRLVSSIKETPALSLWMLVSTLFAEGALTSTKTSNNDGGFWAFLLTAYRQNFIDMTIMGFVTSGSSGGYVKDRPPKLTISQYSNEEIQGRLLAADALWDLCDVLCLVFKSATHLPSSAWLSPRVVKELLESTTAQPFPYSNVAHIPVKDNELELQLHGFKLRVMRRLLAMSAAVPLGSDVLDAVLPSVLESHFDEESENTIASIVSFISDVRASRSTRQHGANLYELARSHAVETTNPVALFCKTALVNLSMLEKPIHRTRFRQPLLRSLSARLDCHASLRASISVDASVDKSSRGSTPKPANSWNWGSGPQNMNKQSKSHDQGNAHDPNVTNSSSSPTPQCIISEAKTILPIYLTFALASMHLDCDSDAPNQRQRRQKELRREEEFFNKEFANTARDVPELAKCHCECILALGMSSIDLSASYSVAFEQLNNVLKSCAKELTIVHRNDLNGGVKRKSASDRTILIDAIQISIQALYSLSEHLCHRMRVLREFEEDEVEVVKMCVASVMSDGVAQSLELVADRALPVSITEVIVDLLSIWLPREPDNPTRCLTVGPTFNCGHRNEFDEFDDEEMMGLLATVELDNPNTKYHQVCLHIEEYTRDVAVVGIRVALQRLLISLPRKLWYKREELYLLDILGSMIASCSFSFNWSVVTLVSPKQRMLAPRLMSSILKHRLDKEWLSTCFMSEQNADAELSTTWLAATLDLRALMPKSGEGVHTENSGDSKKPSEGNYSSYWTMLTDGIITNILRENTVIRYKMDHLLYELLHTSAIESSFREEVKLCPNPQDVKTLYRLHVNVFRSFCRAAGGIWQRLMADPTRFRQEINRFRSKMMDKQRGVFIVLPEQYEVNLRAVCLDLDRKNINWYSISSRFLDEFSSLSSQSGSLHAIDDATSILDRKLADPAIRPIVVLFKFMYDCVDAFLFNCGGMAIGQQNIFFSIIELMFRQAKCAEFPTAERHFQQIRPGDHAPVVPTEKVPAQSIPGVSPACAGFVESVRLFFAYQKYPSLINWFAQNLETYQTLRAGWSSSPLRVLLYNVLDPHGQLGIHSYYPMLADSTFSSGFEPSAIRREAFYLSCGLLHCRCTESYEHSRQVSDYLQEERRRKLLDFILVDFVNELINSAVAGGEDINETLLPVFQFVKALLHHLNLNGKHSDSHVQHSISDAFISCLGVATRHAVKTLITDKEVNESMSCVMLIEFLRIVEELVSLIDTCRDKRLSEIVTVGLRCAGFAYNSLRRSSSGVLEMVFSESCSEVDSLRQVLEELEKHDEVKSEVNIKRESSEKSRFTSDDYGISRIRSQADLLSSIQRLVKKCSEVDDAQSALQQLVVSKAST